MVWTSCWHSFASARGIIQTAASRLGGMSGNIVLLPEEIKTKIQEVGFFESVPLWIVTLLGSLFITILAFVMIMTVYGRFFKLYMYTAIAPIPLSTFAGEPASSIGKAFLKSYAGVCLEGGYYRAGLHYLLGLRRSTASQH